MSEQASHSPETQELPVQQDSDTEALYASFDLRQPAEKKEIEFPVVDEPTDPATGQDEETETQTSAKTLRVKFNKEEVEVPEDQIPEYVQRGLALEKERERREKNDKLLQEAAKLLGLDSLDETAIERVRNERLQQQQQQQADAYNQLRAELREQAEDAGLDPDKVEAWLDNHPDVKEAKALKEQQQLQSQQQQVMSKWDALYKKYPHLADESQAFTRGEIPSFYTDEMKSRVERGYDPLDAYELAHGTEMRTEMQTKTKKQAEQQVLKQIQLGTRAFSDQGSPEPEENDLLPAQLALAEMFGVKPEGVKKQQKLIQSRR